MALLKFKMEMINAVAENLCVMILLDISKFTYIPSQEIFNKGVTGTH